MLLVTMEVPPATIFSDFISCSAREPKGALKTRQMSSLRRHIEAMKPYIFYPWRPEYFGQEMSVFNSMLVEVSPAMIIFCPFKIFR